jgi:hypothetical protein
MRPNCERKVTKMCLHIFALFRAICGSYRRYETLIAVTTKAAT